MKPDQGKPETGVTTADNPGLGLVKNAHIEETSARSGNHLANPG
jgi:hypothetical protein